MKIPPKQESEIVAESSVEIATTNGMKRTSPNVGPTRPLFRSGNQINRQSSIDLEPNKLPDYRGDK